MFDQQTISVSFCSTLLHCCLLLPVIGIFLYESKLSRAINPSEPSSLVVVFIFLSPSVFIEQCHQL